MVGPVRRLENGISVWHGKHHDAQKLMTSGFPLNAARVIVRSG